ncbi:phosphoglycolate phosphatase [Xylariaceae sp. FL0594]|nr:phosphoglycolate phosphatase [Xylariaceae sp. FL0594]
MRPTRCILFDCDNTLCLTEGRAAEAARALLLEICEKHGVSDAPDTVDRVLLESVGKNFRGILASLQERYGLVFTEQEIDAYVHLEMTLVTRKLQQKCDPCPGAPQQLAWAKQRGYEMAVVSTSAAKRLEVTLLAAGIGRFFAPGQVYSAVDSLPLPTPKPDPAIYEYACKRLEKDPSECVAIEDSVSGALAASAAKIPLIGYVGAIGIDHGQEKMEEAAAVLQEKCGAAVIMYDWDEFPKCLKQIETLRLSGDL